MSTVFLSALIQHFRFVYRLRLSRRLEGLLPAGSSWKSSIHDGLGMPGYAAIIVGIEEAGGGGEGGGDERKSPENLSAGQIPALKLILYHSKSGSPYYEGVQSAFDAQVRT